jgi:hypothetical protein
MTEPAIEMTPAVRDRAALAKQASDANIKLTELQKAYAESPEMRIQRDRAELERLQSDPYLLARSAREIEVLEGRIRQNEAAVAQTEAERVDAIIRGEMPIAGAEITVGDQIPRRDLATAVGDIIERGVRPELVKTYLETGRGDDPAGRDAEIAAAREWHRRLMADTELQRRLIAGDAELVKQLAAYGVYAQKPDEV